jgi:triosephosphate isomerase
MTTNRKKMVAGNWKMHNDQTAALGLCREIVQILNDEKRNDAEVVLFPPFTALSAMNKLLNGGGGIQLGAQNMHHEDKGAYTGEISGGMLTSVGCGFVLIGHSERRQYFAESNSFLNQKCHAAFRHGLCPVFCVGERLEERESGVMWEVLSSQIKEGLAGVSASSPRFIVAYEPVWAIGTGKTASADQAQEVHAFIRSTLGELITPEIAMQVTLLYGGSVKPDNAGELFSKPDIDGGLIGGAALDARSFCEIVKSCPAS